MPIKVLPTHLVNKIAAGEVIERPASIVKELVENALDAAATRIDVAVEDGGRRLVQVTDDGAGMGRDDLALAFAPHATSKIAAEDDLYRIETMGFRGEALPSIASVSHASIRTRRADEQGGWEIDAAGGEISLPRPCPAAPGTTVAVRDLFYNTPARRKFLRAASTELGHVVEQLARLALPHPHVAFRLAHNGRKVKDLPAVESTRRRVADLFGPELADELLPVARRGGGVEVAGLVGAPAAARASARWQYLLLNGRYIRDRSLSHALREAFRGRLDPNLSPVAFLFLRVPAGEVDVNVHPTKIEVRFRDSQRVHGELLACLKDALNKADLRPSALPAPAQFGEPQGLAPEGAGAGVDSDEAGEPVAPAGDLEQPPPDAAGEQRRQSLREALADFFRSVPPAQPRLSFPEGMDAHRPAPHTTDHAPLRQRPAPAGTGDAVEDRPVPPAAAPAPHAGAVMQIHGSYIVAQCDDGLVIADQHALHERLLYNELRSRLASGRLAAQRLLIPEPLRVTPAEAALLDARRELLSRLGIEVESFGPDTAAVQQFPSLLAERGVAAGAFLRELLDRLADDESADAERLLEDVLAVMACHAAVKAGSPLSPDEMQALIARAEEADKSAACPHGRPTMLRLTLRDLERQFRRT